MELEPDRFFHLTYCTNIHPGEGWDEVFANLQRYAPALKKRLSPNSPYGLGLRLSAAESEQLLHGERLKDFKAFLDEHGLYVAIINGFPYGSFHKQVVKEHVFAPDWQSDERVEYTLKLLEILRHLLPADLDGGISTLPLSYKQWIAEDADTAWEKITGNVVRVARALIALRQSKGRVVHLDIEPEPDGLIENSEEVVDFYHRWLLPVGGTLLAEELGVSLEEAKQYLLEHIRVCFDTCHFAVEYEDPRTALDRLSAAGIKIGRVQVSSALKVALPGAGDSKKQVAALLRSFAESTYLHQTIALGERKALRHYADLPEGLAEIEEVRDREWRIHFHVPLFTDDFGLLHATQDYIKQVFDELRRTRFTRHLEIETYTWDVLPHELKQDLLESIDREFRWVLKEFHA
jgi:sugar phosphate isomerase/epimerase